MPTVLIAEDDLVLRRVLTFSVKKGGFNVKTAGDGRAAIEILNQGGIDFLCTDQQMPHLTGEQLLEHVKAHQLLPPNRAILCTAKGLEIDIDYYLNQFDLVAVLRKPFSPKRLLQSIETALADGATASIPTEAANQTSFPELSPQQAIASQVGE